MIGGRSDCMTVYTCAKTGAWWMQRRSTRGVLASAGLAMTIGACPMTAIALQPDQPGSGGARGGAPAGAPSVTSPSSTDFTPPQPNKARPADQADKPADPDAPVYAVSRVEVIYQPDHPSLPGLDDVMKTSVTLGVSGAGYVAPGEGVATETFTLEEIAFRAPAKYSSAAMFILAQRVAARLNELGIAGAQVLQSEQEFGEPDEAAGDQPWGKDLRTNSTKLTLGVRIATVSDVRTLAFGDRLPFEQRVNAPEHAKIRDRSPVKPTDIDSGDRTDIIRKRLLDEYVFRLNRHPGRRVDTAVAEGSQPGSVSLDYLVSENRPWLIYGQVSNTGTKQTREWRQRMGFQHTQLTGSDDILSLDYITAGFDRSHSFSGSYERPVYADWLRGKVFGSWSRYRASDVGLADVSFRGESFAVGGELSANVYQFRELFVDVYAGVRYQHIETTQQPTPQTETFGESDFFLPSVGTRLERNTETASTSMSLGFEFNLPDVADTKETAGVGQPPLADDLARLGRLAPDREWTAFIWDLNQTLYLDELFFGDDWRDPANQKRAVLAHEVALGLRGQYAFGSRLVPNFEQTAGGLFTVRGYPESAVAGDNVIIGTAEYRLHLPALFGYNPEPGALFGETFRYQPQQPYGRADWDIVFKTFIDVGRVENEDRRSFERDETLVGTGVGLDFVYKRNFNLRVDWGVALEEIEGEVKKGSNRFHILATFLF
jgi:hemolysin activation/secretion protein